MQKAARPLMIVALIVAFLFVGLLIGYKLLAFGFDVGAQQQIRNQATKDKGSGLRPPAFRDA